VTPESSRAPLRNPDVAPPLSPLTPSADAHAALLDMAQQDGWSALYDPTGPDMVTLDGSGNAIGLKDSLGQFPDATNITVSGMTIPGRALSSVGSLKASQSGWMISGRAASNLTI